jgi:hypothetical protein
MVMRAEVAMIIPRGLTRAAGTTDGALFGLLLAPANANAVADDGPVRQGQHAMRPSRFKARRMAHAMDIVGAGAGSEV